MVDIRNRFNLVAAIAAAGAALAFVGTIMSWREFPQAVGFLDMVIFGMMTFVGILNVKPSSTKRSAIWNSMLGVLGIVVTVINYIRINDQVPDASAFMDVGLGIWLTFAGIIIFTIFSISAWMYKRKP